MLLYSLILASLCLQLGQQQQCGELTHCRSCLTNTKCTSHCMDGYMQFADRQCRRCPDPGCKNCSWDFVICNSCFDNFTLVNGACIPCEDTNCAKCSADASVCEKCDPGYGLMSGSCYQCATSECYQCNIPSLVCSSCPSGLDGYANEGTSCLKCSDPHCTKCS